MTQTFLFLGISYTSSIFLIFALLLCTLSFFFNKKGKYLISKVLFFFYIDSVILTASIYLDNPLLTHYYYIVIYITTFVFDFSEILYLIGIIIVNVSFVFFGKAFSQIFLFGTLRTCISKEQNFIILLGILSFALLSLLTHLYYQNNNQKFIIDINSKLKISTSNASLHTADLLVLGEACSHFLKSSIYVFNVFIGRIENGLLKNKNIDDLLSSFTIIKASINEEERFINSVFEYNKLISINPVYTTFSINQMIKSELENIQKEKKDINFSILCKKDYFVSTDIFLVSKIIDVLVENIYCYNTNIEKKIEIQIFENRNVLSINFIDNGIGILPAYSEDIFRPFVRPSTEENIEGVGMGLLKARKAATKIDAEIILLHTSKNGSTFQLNIPIKTNENGYKNCICRR